MPKSVAASLHKGTLAILCLTALAGIAHSAFWRSMPAAFEPDLEGLEIEGYQTLVLRTQAARTDASYAYSTMREWQIQRPQDSERTMRMTLVGVHSRSDKGLDIVNLANHPSFGEVEERRTVIADQGNIIGTATSIGRSGNDAVLQTCLPAGGHAHVAPEELAQSITAQRAAGWMNRAQSILGLQANIRWECLLVSISMPADQASNEALHSAWNSLYPALIERLEASKNPT